MILIAYSRKDKAGINIAKMVLDDYQFTDTDTEFQGNPVCSAKINGKYVILVELNDETVYAQDLPGHFSNLELVVFLSRHSSQSGRPTFSVHTPGNLDKAELGGLPKRVSVASPSAMRDALKGLLHFKTSMNLDYEVSYECTHHGPSLNVPTIFVELGSSPMQWDDFPAAKAVAKAAMQAVSNFGTSREEAVVGIGGPHYNKRFTNMALSGQALFGHMIPKYAIQSIDVEILHDCVKRTTEKVTHAVLDWKGIRGEDKSRVLNMLSEVDLPYSKV